MKYSFQRYLEAKKRVDDRALNQRVWEGLKTALIGAGGRDPVRILEIGGGIGTMLYRMLADGVLSRASYTLIDDRADNIHAAAELLPKWLKRLGLETASRADGLFVYTPVIAVDTELEAIDLYDFLDREAGQTQWDLVVAHAVLGSFDVQELLPELCSLAFPGALLYFTANYDGLTAFEPVLDPLLDDRIVSLYNHALDNRQVNGSISGGSRTGRHLFTWLERAGLKILDAGSSDGVVFPDEGRYAGDEAYFLHHTLQRIEETLKDHHDLDQAQFADWLAVRHQQVENGELYYIAHQMDFLVQVSA